MAIKRKSARRKDRMPANLLERFKSKIAKRKSVGNKPAPRKPQESTEPSTSKPKASSSRREAIKAERKTSVAPKKKRVSTGSGITGTRPAPKKAQESTEPSKSKPKAYSSRREAIKAGRKSKVARKKKRVKPTSEKPTRTSTGNIIRYGGRGSRGRKGSSKK